MVMMMTMMPLLLYSIDDFLVHIEETFTDDSVVDTALIIIDIAAHTANNDM